MPITLDPLPPSPSVTAKRPLAGMTVLVVEDSRYASEAVRLLCLKSGARIRRADSLRSARRHLGAYVPTALIVDLGLPDGTGLDLIADMATAQQRIPAILATSADDSQFERAVAVGADGTILKPVKSLAAFQAVVLDAMPEELRPEGLRLISAEEIDPDPIALGDDLAHIAEVLNGADGSALDGATVDYAAQFLTGVARSAADRPLEDAARGLAARRETGTSWQPDLDLVEGLLRERLAERRAI